MHTYNVCSCILFYHERRAWLGWLDAEAREIKKTGILACEKDNNETRVNLFPRTLVNLGSLFWSILCLDRVAVFLGGYVGWCQHFFSEWKAPLRFIVSCTHVSITDW